MLHSPIWFWPLLVVFIVLATIIISLDFTVPDDVECEWCESRYIWGGYVDPIIGYKTGEFCSKQCYDEELRESKDSEIAAKHDQCEPYQQGDLIL